MATYDYALQRRYMAVREALAIAAELTKPDPCFGYIGSKAEQIKRDIQAARDEETRLRGVPLERL